MSKVVSQVVGMIGAMSKSEKKEVAEALVSMNLLKRGNNHPYWMRRIDGIDDTEKGPMVVKGDWVKSVQDVTGKGVLVGFKYPERGYAVMKKETGAAKIDVFGHEFENTEVMMMSANFKDAIDYLRTYFG